MAMTDLRAYLTNLGESLTTLRDSLRALADLLLPRTCIVCGCRLGIRERHLCLSCAADVPYTRFWLQAHNPMADRFNAVLERHRGTERMDYAYAAALMYYKGPYRSIPRALKYHGDISAGRFYGSLLGRRLASVPHFADVDLIIPVPLHWSRRWSRGYNQAEILARALAAGMASGRCGRDLASAGGIVSERRNASARCRADLLVRARRTRTQTRLSVEEKSRNVASAFRVPDHFSLRHRFVVLLSQFRYRLVSLWPHPSEADKRRPSRAGHFQPDLESPAIVLASARHIVLIDDTFTTGATLYACYATIRPYTSARISIVTLAVVEGTPSAGP